MVWSGLMCPGEEPIMGPCEHDNAFVCNNVVGTSSIVSEKGSCTMELVPDTDQIFNGRITCLL